MRLYDICTTCLMINPIYFVKGEHRCPKCFNLMVNRAKLSYKALKTYVIKTNDNLVEKFAYKYKKSYKDLINIDLKQNLTGFIELNSAVS